ncbi:YjjG family noncanonical pyrimidine nucleotidase [Paenibacillus glycanilyticus]|uniref:YjjG family noncanonical pyrimidine nucleotidase n=1 Tax=Paenibacillus glycanilyticus TaxID=126569 RepID=UPI001910CEA5|nr:YjjG family noncanonical pyrimidine nucleotidase [Paenibacillus glycanilyticus]
MYKAIIFDLDNTLLDYTYSEAECMRRTVREHNLNLDNEASWNAFWPAYLRHNFKHWMDFVHKRGSHQTIEDVLIHSFRDTISLQDSAYEKLSATYWHHFCNTCYFEPGAEELLQQVQATHKLGIISNGLGLAQRKRLAAGQIYGKFHSIIVSDEAGVRKPGKEIFDLSLEELKLSNSEVLFVGDSLSDDYHGARNAGIDFCFYNRRAVSVSDEIKPTYAIESLKDLISVIQS